MIHPCLCSLELALSQAEWEGHSLHPTLQSGSRYLCLTVQQPDGLVIHLQQHLLSPNLLFGVEQDEFPDSIIHCRDGLALVHDEGGQVLKLGRERR